MQKKVMALAVAGALAAPAAAFAQASNVQIYGRINTGVDNYEAKGASDPSVATGGYKGRLRVFDNGSRFGVRGNEDLGGGLRALFQIESGASVDTGTASTQAGSANSSAGTFASRDSYVGLEGGWGRVTIGRQNVWYTNGVLEQTNANYVNIGLPFFSGTLGRVAGVTARTSNVVAYTSPNMSGFNISGYYSPGSETAQAGAQTDARITAITARYSGVVNVQADWGKNQKAGSGVATPTRPGDLTGLKIGVGYPYMPGAQVAVFVVNSEQAESAAGATPAAGFAAAGDKVKQRGIGVNWEHVFGNIQALAQFARVNKATGCTESAAANPGVSGTTCDKSGYTGIMGGAKYLLSKRTSVYATYARISNEANSNADFAPAGYTSIAGAVPAGVDPRVWAFGVQHNF